MTAIKRLCLCAACEKETAVLEHYSCSECGARFAAPAKFYRAKDVDKLVARVEALESDLTNLLCIFEEIKDKTKEPEILKLAQNALHPKMRKAENIKERP
jgi:hypothetical protein